MSDEVNQCRQCGWFSMLNEFSLCRDCSQMQKIGANK